MTIEHIYRQQMEIKLVNLGKKIDQLEQKTLHSYSDKRSQVLQKILLLRKERQRLLDELLENSQRDHTKWIDKKHRLDDAWQGLIQEYNRSVILIEDVLERNGITSDGLH